VGLPNKIHWVLGGLLLGCVNSVNNKKFTQVTQHNKNGRKNKQNKQCPEVISSYRTSNKYITIMTMTTTACDEVIKITTTAWLWRDAQWRYNS